MSAGYQYVIDALRLKIASPVVPATNTLNAPFNGETNDLIGHLSYALAHEGTHLEALHAICGRIEPFMIQTAINKKPTDKNIRKLGFLYEQFTEKKMLMPAIVDAYIPLFDSALYITGIDRYNDKFRINQNGLNDLTYCPTIRKTPYIDKLMSRDIFADLNDFFERAGETGNIDRIFNWAYLSETRSSFNIESENPSEDKARRFVRLLRQAQQKQDLTEEYLATLQSNVITNPLLQEFSYRTRQNWLQRGSRYRRNSDVTFLPPSPEHNRALMESLLQYANAPYPKNGNEALLKSLMISFGFVFNHPFLDGNGRISRFLIHHGLCRSGLLRDGCLLPVSVAIQKHEIAYLHSLESVSKGIRALWQVNHVGDNDIEATWLGSDDTQASYRYWDGTQIAEFGLKMSHSALDNVLLGEQRYLERFDVAYEQIDKNFDVQGKDITNLIRMIASEGGNLSNRRRKQFSSTVPQYILDEIEAIVQEAFDFCKKIKIQQRETP